jgi:galactonate dehydratase
MTMRITRVETIRFDRIADEVWERERPRSRQAMPNNLWVRIHTDDGLIGLGETYYAPRAVSALIMEFLAPLLLGRSAFDIEHHYQAMTSLASFFGLGGAEMRAISALDIALWDLLGQYTRQPICHLLGGRSRDRIAVYNTCLDSGAHADGTAWNEGRSGELAKDLLDDGYAAMKIWPFDRYAWSLAGSYRDEPAPAAFKRTDATGVTAHTLSQADLESGIAVVADIRRSVGSAMRIAIEGHARWDLPCAARIARALEPYDIMWFEEPMPPDNAEAFRRLKSQTSVPLCQSERLMTRHAFRSIIDLGATDIVMPDVGWCGGLSEARKICSHADTHYLPVTSHDTVGPVVLLASAHLMLHIPNAMIMETVRGYTRGWYHEVLDHPFTIEHGHLSLSDRPGLGAALRPELLRHPQVQMESASL